MPSWWKMLQVLQGSLRTFVKATTKVGSSASWDTIGRDCWKVNFDISSESSNWERSEATETCGFDNSCQAGECLSWSKRATTPAVSLKFMATAASVRKTSCQADCSHRAKPSPSSPPPGSSCSSCSSSFFPFSFLLHILFFFFLYNGRRASIIFITHDENYKTGQTFPQGNNSPLCLPILSLFNNS